MKLGTYPACNISWNDFLIKEEGTPVQFNHGEKELCPSALHVALPYMLAFMEGARFPWEVQSNVVTAMCPAGLVAMKITKLGHDSFKVSFLEAKESCPRHSKGDYTIIKGISHRHVEILDLSFPFMNIIHSVGGGNGIFSLLDGSASCTVALVPGGNEFDEGNPGSSNLDSKWAGDGANRDVHRTISPCMLEQQIRGRDPVVFIPGMKRTCRYPRKTREHPLATMEPLGCIMASHAFYPTLLGMLYGGFPDKKREISCPGVEASIHACITRQPSRVAPYLKLLEKLLQHARFPQDVIWRSVWTIVSGVSGTCQRGITMGTKVRFGETSYLCPSALDGMVGSLAMFGGSDKTQGIGCSCSSIDCRVQHGIKRRDS